MKHSKDKLYGLCVTKLFSETTVSKKSEISPLHYTIHYIIEVQFL